jgi:uncharacterized membrane protein
LWRRVDRAGPDTAIRAGLSSRAWCGHSSILRALFRRTLAKQLLDGGLNDLSERERRVIERIAQRHHVSRNLNRAFEERSTFGERLADRVAAIGGSWAFVTGFGLFLIAWAVLNTEILGHWNDAFDPYPYVFLNLILSMLAAIQAPIIMMSQNRQAAKDRFAAGLDYEVNPGATHKAIKVLR